MGCPSLKTLRERASEAAVQMGLENEIHLKIKIWNSQPSMETIFISVAHVTRQKFRNHKRQGWPQKSNKYSIERGNQVYQSSL